MAEEELDVQAFGKTFHAKGVNVIMLVLMAAALAGCMYMLYERNETTDRRIDAIAQQNLVSRAEQTSVLSMQHETIVAALKSLRDVNEAISTGLIEQNYIILADEKERAEIKRQLRRPASLSRKMEH